MEEQDKIISLEEEIASFERYFDANSRCILSASFGEGKTFFLRKFMEKKCDEYDFITLYPTSYQVCDNKDIFEYIKRDILLALLALELNVLEGYDKTTARIVWDLVVECTGDLMSALPDINVGIPGVQATMSTSKIYDVIKKVAKKSKTRFANRGNLIRTYLNRFDKVSDSNPASNLISSLIAERKAKSKKMVLVIEDLDRIDPAHIFRILNVFSTCFVDDLDEYFAKNKFGFDKVLLMCDYENIKNIYHHLYGEKTDFKGYISKFCAVSPFEYNIRGKIAKHISGLIAEYVKDPVVSSELAKEIVESTKPSDGKVIENIRNIKERIRVTACHFKTGRIDVLVRKNLYYTNEYIERAKSSFDTLYVSTDKPLLSFMAICQAFSLSYKRILEQVDKAPRAYGEPRHVVDLCGLMMIPLMPLNPNLDYTFDYTLGVGGSTMKNELVISDDGEILEIKKNRAGTNILDVIQIEKFLEKIGELEQYLY